MKKSSKPTIVVAQTYQRVLDNISSQINLPNLPNNVFLESSPFCALRNVVGHEADILVTGQYFYKNPRDEYGAHANDIFFMGLVNLVNGLNSCGGITSKKLKIPPEVIESVRSLVDGRGLKEDILLNYSNMLRMYMDAMLKPMGGHLAHFTRRLSPNTLVLEYSVTPSRDHLLFAGNVNKGFNDESVVRLLQNPNLSKILSDKDSKELEREFPQISFYEGWKEVYGWN